MNPQSVKYLRSTYTHSRISGGDVLYGCLEGEYRGHRHVIDGMDTICV